jgi:hypothetical protein
MALPSGEHVGRSAPAWLEQRQIGLNRYAVQPIGHKLL